MDGNDALLFERVLEGLGVAVVVFGPDGRARAENQSARGIAEALAEPAPFEGLRDPRRQMVDELGRPIAHDDLPAVRTLRTGEPQPHTVMGLRTARGTTVWLLVGTEPLHDDAGELTGVICSFIDVTAQRAAQDALRASEERFRLLAENAADLVYRIRIQPEARIEYVNPAVRTMLGYEPEDFYGDIEFCTSIIHPDDRDRGVEMLRGASRGAESIQLRVTRRDGTTVWTEHRIVPMLDADGAIVSLEGIGRDVTALKVKEAFLNHRALHDPLTGLANRVFLLDGLERELARARRDPANLAVLYADIDRFKTVNDNLGHEVGDRLLVAVARRIEGAVRPYDRVARLGGDEFAAVLPDLDDPEEAVLVAERVRAAIGAPIDLGDGEMVATVSVGVAVSTDGVISAGELLRRADFAMYAAKDHGRDRVESYRALDADEPGDRRG